MRDPILEAYKRVIFESEGTEPKKEKFKIPEFLYHATYGKFLPSIYKNGLGGIDNLPTWPNKNNENTEGYVYLASTPDEAEEYARDEKRFANVDEATKKDMLNNIVVLKIYRDKLKDLKNMEIDGSVDSGEDPKTFKYKINSVDDAIKSTCFDIERDHSLSKK